MTPHERAAHLMAIGDRIGAAMDAQGGEIAVVPMTAEEMRLVLECVAEDTSPPAQLVRRMFQRALRQMASETN